MRIGRVGYVEAPPWLGLSGRSSIRACFNNATSHENSERVATARRVARLMIAPQLSRGSLSDALREFSTFTLLAFCAVKGISIPYNVWERDTLVNLVETYLREERTCRIRGGTEWVQMTDEEQEKMLHRVCNGEGDATYIDPKTGYTVFTFFGHLRRGHCCGVKKDEQGNVVERTHRCRHCPYDVDGNLVAKRMVALGERIDIIEMVREFVREDAENLMRGEIDNNEGNLELKEGSVRAIGKEATFERAKVKADSMVAVEMQSDEDKCELCGGAGMITCQRCNGWKIVISPQTKLCPQCDATGTHPCMACTPWRPKQIKAFYH